MRKRNHLTYYTKLILLFGIGCFLLSQNGAAQFTVNGKLITFTDSVAQVCINSPVKFTSTFTEPATVSWVFTGASTTTATGPTTTVTYGSTGVFSAEQTITTADTSYTFSARIIVNDDYPTASFTATPPASQCASEFFKFTNTSPGNIGSVVWQLGSCAGGGVVAGQNTINIDFSRAVGSGISNCPIILTVTNSSGCSASSSQIIQAKQFPSIEVNDVSGPAVFYQNQFVFKTCGGTIPITNTFFNTSTTSATNANYIISWQNSPTKLSLDAWPPEGVTHIFGEGYTSFNIKVTGQNGCSKDRSFLAYGSVQAAPNVTLSATLPALICTPQNLEFAIGQNQNTAGTTYRLSLNDNVSAVNVGQPPPPQAFLRALSGSCGFQSTNGTTIYPNALTATVLAQNPCGSASAVVLPIYASAKAKAGISGATSLCANTASLIGNTGNFGSVVTVQNGVSSCTYNGKMAWEISPATYTIDSGSLGSTNGDYTSINSWQAGTDTFKITFNDTGTYTIKQYIGNGSCGIDSITKKICISIPSRAAFSLNTRQGCPGSTVFKTTNTTPPPTGPCGGEYYFWQVTPINNPGCLSGNNFSFENNTLATSKNIELLFQDKGLYEIRLTSKLSSTSPCLTLFVDTIGIYEKPDANIISIAEICAGDPFTPKATTSECLPNKFQTYKWKFVNGTPATATDSTPVPIRYTKPGNTYMTLETTNSCGTDRDTAYILINEKPIINPVSDTVVCSNNPINLLLASSAGSNTQYSWKSTVITGTAVAGNTTLSKQNVLSITDNLTNNGTTTAIIEYKIVAEPTTLPFKCPSDSATVYVTVLPQIVASKDTLLCLGKTLQLNAVGTNVATWSWTPAASLTNAAIANPVTTTALTTSTMYYVTGTTALGCTNTDSVMVDVTPPFVLEASPKNTYSCIDSSVQIQATGGSTYTWLPATGLSDPNIANPIARPGQTTTYTVTSSDQYNCEIKTDFVTIIVGGFTNVDLTSSSVPQVIAGTQIPLFASTDSANIRAYTWSVSPTDGGTLDCENAAICSQQLATIYKDVTFSVRVENIYGCRQTDTISFKASCISEKQLFVPTAFSPDGNSLNDVFTILGQGFTINYFRIYNRWGSVVFERKEGGKPNDKNYGWNGKMKDGSLASSGIYTCVVEVTCTAGGIFSYKGNVTLIR